MKIAVTGATGFIGSQVYQHLIRRGYEVVSMSRRRLGSEMLWRNYNLDFPASQIDLTDVSAVVHCAYDMHLKSARHLAVNGSAAAELAEACRRAGCRLLNISSVVAFDPTASWYARTKHATEVSVANSGGTNLRLGVLTEFDVDPLAMRIQKVLELSWVRLIPIPSGWVWQSSLKVLMERIELCFQDDFNQSVLWVAGDHAIRFKQHVSEICEFAGMKVPLIEIPMPIVKGIVFPLDLFSKNRSAFSIDSLNGMGKTMVCAKRGIPTIESR